MNHIFDVFGSDNLGCFRFFRCFETYILDVSVVSKQEMLVHLDH